MATTGPICPICGRAHVSCGGPSAAAPIALVAQETVAMGGALETITLTNGRRVRVNEWDKARYARRGMIAGEVAEESAQPMPKAVTLPKRKAKRPAEDKAVKPDADKAKD